MLRLFFMLWVLLCTKSLMAQQKYLGINIIGQLYEQVGQIKSTRALFTTERQIIPNHSIDEYQKGYRIGIGGNFRKVTEDNRSLKVGLNYTYSTWDKDRSFLVIDSSASQVIISAEIEQSLWNVKNYNGNAFMSYGFLLSKPSKALKFYLGGQGNIVYNLRRSLSNTSDVFNLVDVSVGTQLGVVPELVYALKGSDLLLHLEVFVPMMEFFLEQERVVDNPILTARQRKTSGVHFELFDFLPTTISIGIEWKL